MEILHARFDDAGWECSQIMEAMEACDSIYFDRVSQIRMERWTEGRLALVGDAAFCPSLLAGEGCALAMTAAFVLAGELYRASGNYREALHATKAHWGRSSPASRKRRKTLPRSSRQEPR